MHLYGSGHSMPSHLVLPPSVAAATAVDVASNWPPADYSVEDEAVQRWENLQQRIKAEAEAAARAAAEAEEARKALTSDPLPKER